MSHLYPRVVGGGCRFSLLVHRADPHRVERGGTRVLHTYTFGNERLMRGDEIDDEMRWRNRCVNDERADCFWT